MKKNIFVYITVIIVLVAVILNVQIFSSLNKLSALSGKYNLSSDLMEKDHYVIISPNVYSLEWKNLIEGAMEASKENDIILEVIEIENYTVQLQIDYMESAIAANVEGLIIECNDWGAFDAVINEAEMQGVKVAIVNKDRPNTLRTLSILNNNQNEGKIAGELLRNDNGGSGGDGLILVVEELLQENQYHNERTESILAYHDVKGRKNDVLKIDMNNIEESKKVLREYIMTHKIEGIFSTTINTTILTAETLERLGIEVPVVGVGNSFDIKNYIRNGRISYSFGDNHYLIGKRSVEHLYNNETGQIYIDSIVLDASNINDLL